MSRFVRNLCFDFESANPAHLCDNVIDAIVVRTRHLLAVRSVKALVAVAETERALAAAIARIRTIRDIEEPHVVIVRLEIRDNAGRIAAVTAENRKAVKVRKVHHRVLRPRQNIVVLAAKNDLCRFFARRNKDSRQYI